MSLKILLFVITVIIIGSRGFHPPWMFMGTIIRIDSSTFADPEWFNQSLDHFGKNGTKWKQRYWKNDAYAEEKNDLHFLILGGESAASPSDVFYDHFPHVQYAKEVNATLWTLEHRFYGESQPFENLEDKNLKYLKSHQALADIAYFIKFQNTVLNLTNPKWILFGGSYAGTLAIWFRELFSDDLSYGVVASSAPIDLRLDFYDYLKFTEYLINSSDPKCANDIRDGFKDLEKNLTKNSRTKFSIGKTFNTDPNLKDLNYTFENVAYLYINLQSYFQASVQYNNAEAFKNSIGISYFCKDMANYFYEKPSYSTLAYTLRNMIKGFTGSFDHIYVNYDNLISYLQDYSGIDPVQASTRAWTWQVCNEFGNFLTTNGGKSIFGNHISYNFYVGLCIDVFGKKYSIINTQYGLQKIKKNYGYSSVYNGTNVIASRNYYDPWSLLTLVKPNDSTIITYNIDGTGHCADMAPISNNGNDSLIKYRKFVLKTIKKWIGI